MALTPKTKLIVDYLQENNDKDLTAADLAEALGMEKKSIDGAFTSLQKKGYGVRVPGEVENDDGTHRAVKYMHLTDDGMALDTNAAEETK